MNFQTVIKFLPTVFRVLVIIVPIVISILTLRQNKKMIEESTRAYVTIYLASYIINNKNYVLVIKNFGKTGAVINSITCNKDLSQISYVPDKTPFSSMEGTYIAPNQLFTCAINDDQFINIGSADFTVKYSTTTRTYTETVSINFCYDMSDTYIKFSTGKNDHHIRSISFSLQELVRQNL